MPTFELTSGEWLFVGCTVALVLLPSQLTRIGDWLGRTIKRAGPTQQP